MKILTIYLIFLLNIIYVCSCKAGDSVIDQKDEKKISADMVRVPAGEFIMGTNACTYIWSDDPSNIASEEDNCIKSRDNPRHKVYVDEFFIDVYEVTMADYYECAKAGACREAWFVRKIKKDGYNGDSNSIKPDWPARGILWYDARDYCKWKGKRLPTEAEWEKAARGPEGYANPWGNERVKDGFTRIGRVGLGPVGTIEKDRSGYGVYDMAGNVAEWVSDWYDKDYFKNSPRMNPKGPDTGTMKTTKGEYYITNNKMSSRYNYFATSRFRSDPNKGKAWVGFRCAKSVEDK